MKALILKEEIESFAKEHGFLAEIHSMGGGSYNFVMLISNMVEEKRNALKWFKKELMAKTPAIWRIIIITDLDFNQI